VDIVIYLKRHPFEKGHTCICNRKSLKAIHQETARHERSNIYGDRLAHLGIPSLELRRFHLDLISYYYKIVFGLTCLDTKTFFTLNPISVMRGHAYKLYKPQCQSSLCRIFFVERVIIIWNSLPKNVDFLSLSKFKKSINQTDFSLHLKNTP